MAWSGRVVEGVEVCMPRFSVRTRVGRVTFPIGTRTRPQKYQGNGDQSAARFSRKASRPSAASSVM